MKKWQSHVYFREMKKYHGHINLIPNESNKGRDLLRMGNITEEERDMIKTFFKSIMKCPNCKTTFMENVKICENCGFEIKL